MTLLFCIIWCFYMIGFLFCKKIPGELKEEGILSYFYKISWFLFQFSVFQKIYNKRTEKDLTLLYPVVEKNHSLKLYYTKKTGLLLFVFFLSFNLIFVYSIVQKQDSILLHNRELVRNHDGEKTEEIDLIINDGTKDSQIHYSLRGQIYSRKQFDQKVSAFEEHLEELILGDNVSFENVTTNLLLISKYEGYPFVVDWFSDNPRLVDFEGVVSNCDLQEAILVNLQAELRYDTYQTEISFPICVRPIVISEEEMKERKMLEEIRQADEKQKENETFLLPEKLDGNTVTYQLKDERNTAKLFLLLFLFLGVLFYAKDQDLKNKVEKRNKELVDAYPEFISKFVLLFGAGMSIRNVLHTLCLDQQQNVFLRQELMLLDRDLNNGVLESTAIDAFGKRCKSTLYIKFCAYLIQNQKKGNKELAIVLEQEAREAFMQKKNDARRLGEEAGTKLLLPMICMLLIVMIIVVLPAFLSF